MFFHHRWSGLPCGALISQVVFCGLRALKVHVLLSRSHCATLYTFLFSLNFQFCWQLCVQLDVSEQKPDTKIQLLMVQEKQFGIREQERSRRSVSQLFYCFIYI